MELRNCFSNRSSKIVILNFELVLFQIFQDFNRKCFSDLTLTFSEKEEENPILEKILIRSIVSVSMV